VAGTAAWWAIVALSVATDLLLVVLAVGLDGNLRPAAASMTRIAVMFVLLFVVLDLAVQWPATVAMIELGSAWSSASPSSRVAVEAAAAAPATVLDSPLTSPCWSSRPRS
jgi:hypothetical protein